MGFVVVAALVIVVIGFFWLVLSLVKESQDGRAEAVANREDIVRRLFDGSDQVTYKAGPSALSVEEVTADASRLGYEVVTVTHAGGQYAPEHLVTFRRRG